MVAFGLDQEELVASQSATCLQDSHASLHLTLACGWLPFVSCSRWKSVQMKGVAGMLAQHHCLGRQNFVKLIPEVNSQ